MKRALALAVAVTALAVPAAFAKEGAQAHLVAPLPAHPVPGTKITIRWTVDVPDESGGRRPFGAIGMFVRLIGTNGARTTTTAGQSSGTFSAFIRVPHGGIRAVRFGLHGTTDIFFPLR